MHNQRSHNRQPSCHNRTLEIKNRTRTMEKTKAEEPMRTMTKERKKVSTRSAAVRSGLWERLLQGSRLRSMSGLFLHDAAPEKEIPQCRRNHQYPHDQQERLHDRMALHMVFHAKMNKVVGNHQ